MGINELMIETESRQIKEAAKTLEDLLAINDARRKDQRVPSLTHVVSADDSRFIAVNGSAHLMAGLFAEFFRKRPEFRGVVQDVLDSMYKIDNGFMVNY